MVYREIKRILSQIILSWAFCAEENKKAICLWIYIGKFVCKYVYSSEYNLIRAEMEFKDQILFYSQYDYADHEIVFIQIYKI